MAISFTIDDLDAAVVKSLQDEARRRGVDVNLLVKEFLRHAIAETPEMSDGPHHDLDALAGTWSDQDAEAFLAAIADLGRVDASIWA